jgi:protein TonB
VALGPSTGEHTIVQSTGGALSGKGLGGSGVPGGTGAASGSRQGVVGGTGTGSAQPVTLSLKNWKCPWPAEAEYEDFDEQVVSIKVVVAEDGHVEQAEIVSDPGYGFGRHARDCARRVRFNPAKDGAGRAIKAMSPPIVVRFVR